MKISNAIFSAFIVGVSMLLVNIVTFASEPSENQLVALQAQGQLKIAVSVADSQGDKETLNIVPNQQVTIVVELLSTHPFNDNYTLPYFDVDNAVVTPPDDKTSLAIKVIDGQQWFIQRKEISIYPLKEGDFSIPSLTATAFIKLEKQELVTGTISSELLNFTVNLPAELHGINNFIASPNVSFTLKQTQEVGDENKADEKRDTSRGHVSYDKGSAITLTYRLKADNMHVIMLDKVTLPKITGIQVYEKPAIEKDVFDRFEKFNSAEITQSFTLIFQEEGQYKLPAQRITWWDVTTQKVKEIKISSQKFMVGDGASAHNSATAEQAHSFIDVVKSLWSKLLAGQLADKNTLLTGVSIFAVIFFCIAVLRKILLHRKALIDSFQRFNKTRQKQLVDDFSKHISNKNYQVAMSCLYQLSQESLGATGSLTELLSADDVENQQRLRNLQILAFKPEQAGAIYFSLQDAEVLSATLMKKQPRWNKRESFKFSSTLNPNL